MLTPRGRKHGTRYPDRVAVAADATEKEHAMFSSSLAVLLADFIGIGDFHMSMTAILVLVVVLLAPEVWAWLWAQHR